MKKTFIAGLVIVCVLFFVVLYFVLNNPASTTNTIQTPIKTASVWSPNKGEMTWDNAAKACADSSPQGTWRLPTKDELSVALNNQFSKNLLISGELFTSSNAYWTDGGYNHNSSDTGAFAVGGGTNGVFSDYYSKDREFLVRCVK